MRYLANDGNDFATEQECLEHENKLRELETEKAKLAAEKKSRGEAVANEYREFVKMYDDYKRDYGEPMMFAAEETELASWINRMLRF